MRVPEKCLYKMAAMTSRIQIFKRWGKMRQVNILESICIRFHWNRNSHLACRADTHIHTYIQTYRHPRLDSNIFSQNKYLYSSKQLSIEKHCFLSRLKSHPLTLISFQGKECEIVNTTSLEALDLHLESTRKK